MAWLFARAQISTGNQSMHEQSGTAEKSIEDLHVKRKGARNE